MATPFLHRWLSDPDALAAWAVRASAGEIAAVLRTRVRHEPLLAAVLQGPQIDAVIVGELLRQQCSWSTILTHPVVTGAMLLEGATGLLDPSDAPSRATSRWARTHALEAARVVLQTARLATLHDTPPTQPPIPPALLAHVRGHLAPPPNPRAGRPGRRTPIQHIEAEHALAVLVWAGAATPRECAARWEVHSALCAGVCALPWVTRPYQWNLLQHHPVPLRTRSATPARVAGTAHALTVLTMEAQAGPNDDDLGAPSREILQQHWASAVRTYLSAPDMLALMSRHWRAVVRRVPVTLLRTVWRDAAAVPGARAINPDLWHEATHALAVAGVFDEATVTETLHQGHAAAREAMIATMARPRVAGRRAAGRATPRVP